MTIFEEWAGVYCQSHNVQDVGQLRDAHVAGRAEGAAVVAREPLAALSHEQWSGWMRYMFSKCYAEDWDGKPHPMTYIPTHLVERWLRQMNTPYADLPESEKESDRVEADKMIAVMRAAVDAAAKERGE